MRLYDDMRANAKTRGKANGSVAETVEHVQPLR